MEFMLLKHLSFKHNTSNFFVRLLGEHNQEASTNAEYAGWAIDNNAAPNVNPQHNASFHSFCIS